MVRRLVLACVLVACSAAGLARLPDRVPLFGYADAGGKIVVEPIYPYVTTSFDSDWVAVSSGEKAGFINLRTGAATGLIFDGVFSDLGTFALFRDGPEPVRLGSKWGYADEAGRMILPAQYDGAGRFGPDGLAVVTFEGRLGFIDVKGELTLPGRYDRIRDFRNGLAVVDSGGKSGAIDTRGKLVVPARFAFLGNFSSNGLAAASLDGGPLKEGAHYGFIDGKGRFRIPPAYAFAAGFDQPAREEDQLAPPGLARVSNRDADGSERMSYVDESGRSVTTLPAGLVGWHVGRNGLILVQDQKTAKWGFADAAGRIVVPATLDGAAGFGPNGLAAAYVGGKWGHIRADGRFAIEPAFESAAMFDSHDRAQAWRGKQSMLIDEKGRAIATFPAGRTWLVQPGGYVAIETFPPQIDYPVRRFGRWTLERTVYAVPEMRDLLPTPNARVRLSMLSGDGAVAWRVETEGWTLNVTTEVFPPDAARTDYNSLDVMPVGAIGLLDIFRRQLSGEFEQSISFESGDPAVKAEQARRMQGFLSRRDAYLQEVYASRADLARAWAAMGADVADQFGSLSGRPCMPPQCMY